MLFMYFMLPPFNLGIVTPKLMRMIENELRRPDKPV